MCFTGDCGTDTKVDILRFKFAPSSSWEQFFVKLDMCDCERTQRRGFRTFSVFWPAVFWRFGILNLENCLRYFYFRYFGIRYSGFRFFGFGFMDFDILDFGILDSVFWAVTSLDLY